MGRIRYILAAGASAVAIASAAPALAQSGPWNAGQPPGAIQGAAPVLAVPGGARALPQAQPIPVGGGDAAAAAGLPAPQSAARTTSPRPGESLGLTQKAWEDPQRHMGKGQSAPGYTRLQWAPDKILAVHTREGLITAIVFPSTESIVQVIVSDQAAIEAVASPDKHSIAVKPIYPGIDGNIVVYGSSGNTYNIYITSAAYNDTSVSDLRVSIDVPSAGGADASGGAGGPAEGTAGGRGGAASTTGVAADDPSAALTRPRAKGAALGREYAATALTGPGRLRTDLVIKVSDPGDAIIAPVAAWRDDKFEYLDFGPRASSMNTWPVASLVVDEVESPVGTRVSGPNRSIMVVEALGDVVLRNGTHMVCVKMDVADHDPRRPLVDETYRDRPGLSPVVAPAVMAVAAHGAAAGMEGTVAMAAVDSTGPGTAVSGPYPLDRALALASDVVKGYHGKVTEDDVHILGPAGRRLDHDGIVHAPAGGRYLVEVTGNDRMPAAKVCGDLRKSGRTCRMR